MKIEVSNGEIVDKITILKIKLKNINDKKKLDNIQVEYDTLKNYMVSFGVDEESDSFKKMYEINEKIWLLEENIRKKEDLNSFDAEFIDIARQIYKVNDERAILKKKINEQTKSFLVEEKSYSWV